MTAPTSTRKTPKSGSSQKTDLVDVSFGLPLYMQEYWDFFQHMHGGNVVIKHNQNMPYNYGNTKLSLEHAICALHKHVGNAVTDGAHIVTGHGASQMVSAIAYATAKLKPYTQILLEPPYWGRLKFLLELGISGAGPGTSSVQTSRLGIGLTGSWFKFATSPNNPTAHMSEPAGDLSVVDMCYYWPQYARDIQPKSHDVMIFGLSKATGHAGTRLGWAIVKNKQIADLMREYVELSTGGMSSDAQTRGELIILAALSAKKHEMPDCFDFAKDKLRKRWAALKSIDGEFDVLNKDGMFAWCKLNSDKSMEDLYGLKVTPASGLGLADTTGCFRINLGCADDVFAAMMKALDDRSKTT